MKTLHIIICFIISLHVCGQQVRDVIDVERRFAKYAADYHTKDAFLQFLDSNAVVFRDGKILRAKEVWSHYTPSDVKLTWQPAFAGISRSGDLGFTTGPWQVRKTLNDTAFEVGSYATVWQKTKYGEWKFIVDIGVGYKKPQRNTNEVKTLKRSLVSGKIQVDVMSIEKAFLKALAEKGNPIFADYFHENCWLNVEGYPPMTSVQAIRRFISSSAKNDYSPVAGGIASSGDIAYVYGNSELNGKRENYLRVWQNTAKGWKIVMMTGPVPR